MASTTYRRIGALPHRSLSHPTLGDISVVKHFSVFVDTHRDLPHVGSFEDDLHRGMCKPAVVHLWYPMRNTYDLANTAAVDAARAHPDGILIHAVTNKLLPLHNAHRFVTTSWWQSFVQDWILDKGADAFDPSDGGLWLHTSVFRDPRRGVYKLKSFRQIVMDNIRYRDNACWRAENS